MNVSRPSVLERAGASLPEIAFLIALTTFAVFFIYASQLITEPPRNVIVGPRTFPFIVGVGMLLVVLRLLWSCLRATPTNEAEDATVVVPLEDDDVLVSDWQAVWVVIGSLLALIVLFEPLGFIIAMSLFLFGLSTFFSPKRWPVNLAVAIGFSVVFYFLFTALLEVGLPQGVLNSVLATGG